VCLAPRTRPPGGTRAGQTAAFDQVLQRVVGPDSLTATSAAYDADLERLRTALPAGDRARDARFRSVYCGSSTWRNPVQALAYADDALALARDLNDTSSEARALLCRAEYVMLTSGTQRGLPEVDKAVDLLANGHEPQLLGESLETRGDILSLLGEQAKAMLDFQRARAAYRQAGIAGEVESLVLSLAVAYRSRPVYAPVSTEQASLDRYRDSIEPLRRVVVIGVPIALGLFAGSAASQQWQTFLLWWNRVPFRTRAGAFPVSSPAQSPGAGVPGFG